MFSTNLPPSLICYMYCQYFLCCRFIKCYLLYDFITIGYPATAIKHNTTLSELRLRGCGLEDDAICELCGGLKWCRLKTLGLQFNGFGDQGAKSLADVIKDNTTLEKLGMFGCNNISDGVVQYLMDAMRSNTTLKILTLSYKYKHLVPLELVSRVRSDI